MRPIAPYVILSCHGDEGRILMEDVAEERTRFQPFNGAIGPDRVREHFQLSDNVTPVTGCDTGEPALADAFLLVQHALRDLMHMPHSKRPGRPGVQPRTRRGVPDGDAGDRRNRVNG
ncbi:hypothetical protein [Streptomyces sp. NPDC018693]|uniref:hypothetical protein n=1 Tax=unclassified Streptomyces TaxID=2593676 RepID=UPI0037A8C95D